MNKLLSLIFFGFSILYLVIINTHLLEPQSHGLVLLKSLPIALLAFIALQLVKFKKAVVVIAVLFSLAGDVLLGYGWFIPGLGAFLIAQLTYAFLFFKAGQKPTLTKGNWLLLTGLICIALGVLAYSWSNLGNLKLPVMLYMLAILTMGTLAVTSKAGQPTRTIGAVLFVLSDSCIAINKFGDGFAGASVVIMTTYYLAQYFILTSFIKQPANG